MKILAFDLRLLGIAQDRDSKVRDGVILALACVKDKSFVVRVLLRRSRMFIATSRFNDPSSVGAKCDSLDNISLLRSLLNHIEAIGL